MAFDIAVDIAIDSRSRVGRHSVDCRSILGRKSVDNAVDSRSIVDLVIFQNFPNFGKL